MTCLLMSPTLYYSMGCIAGIVSLASILTYFDMKQRKEKL